MDNNIIKQTIILLHSSRILDISQLWHSGVKYKLYVCNMPLLEILYNFSIVTMCQVRIWEIPDGGLRRNLTEAVLELYGHSRRVGLIEWHPTTSGILFSAGYDYKVMNSFAM